MVWGGGSGSVWGGWGGDVGLVGSVGDSEEVEEVGSGMRMRTVVELSVD